MSIDITYDLTCPFCYVTLTRLERVLQDVEVQLPPNALHLHPFQLQPDMPAEGMPLEVFFTRKFGAQRAAEIYQRVASMAAADGLHVDYRTVPRMPNTRVAHEALLFIVDEKLCLQAAVALMKAHFTGAAFIGDKGVVTSLLEELGCDAGVESFIGSAEVASRLSSARRRAEKLNIAGVPSIRLDDRELGSMLPIEQLQSLVWKVLEQGAQ